MRLQLILGVLAVALGETIFVLDSVCVAQDGISKSAESAKAATTHVRVSPPFPLDLAFTARTSVQNSEKAAIDPLCRFVVYGTSIPSKRRNDISTFASGLPIWMIGNRLNLVELATNKTVRIGGEGANCFCPSWSPDGSMLAYYSDEGGALRAWIFDIAKGRAVLAAPARVKVHVYSAAAMPPTWSPDGGTLLIPGLPADEEGADPRPGFGIPKSKKGPFESQQGITVVTSGDEPRRASSTEIQTFTHYDGVVDIVAIDIKTRAARILLPAKVKDRAGPAFAKFSASGERLVVVSHFKINETSKTDEAEITVFRRGEEQPAFRENVVGCYSGVESYSRDLLGRSGVVLAWHPKQETLLFINNHRLRCVHFEQGSDSQVKTLAEEIGEINGDYLAIVPEMNAAMIGAPESGGARHFSELGNFVLAPLDGSASTKFRIPTEVRNPRLIRQEGVSLWQPIHNTASILDDHAEGTRTLIRRLNLKTGEWTTASDQPGSLEIIEIASDKSFLLGLARSYASPEDFYQFSSDFTSRKKLSTIEPRLSDLELGAAETFNTVVPLHDGRLTTVRTAILLPPGARKGDRLPAILTFYGGIDKSRSIHDFGGGSVSSIPAPVFTTRGFAVIMASAPIGSEGQPGQPIEELRDVVLPQVYHAAELGYVDIERIAVTGNSYGGYGTAALISSTNLFRAAASIAGSYDLAGDYGRLRIGDNHHIEWAEKGQGRMGQPPWSDVRRYLDNSPYYRADRIRTPLLLIHGRDDTGCHVSGAEMMFSALRRLNRTSQLAVYDGEGHAISEWDADNAVNATERLLTFFERYLGSK